MTEQVNIMRKKQNENQFLSRHKLLTNMFVCVEIILLIIYIKI